MRSCLRLGKEVKMYEKESKSLEEKVKQMESEGKDEYDIRKQVGQEIDGKFYKAI
jgi:hypothetical protein